MSIDVARAKVSLCERSWFVFNGFLCLSVIMIVRVGLVQIFVVLLVMRIPVTIFLALSVFLCVLRVSARGRSSCSLTCWNQTQNAVKLPAIFISDTRADTVLFFAIVILVYIGTFLIGCRLSTQNLYAHPRRPIPTLSSVCSVSSSVCHWIVAVGCATSEQIVVVSSWPSVCRNWPNSIHRQR